MMHPLPEQSPLIRARGVSKSFGSGDARVQVLHGVDLDIFGGEITFLTGASGSGKTTLISILTAILTPDGGDISVLGRDVGRGRVSSLARFRRESVGFVFQQFNLLPTLTAVENASVPLLAAGVSRTIAEGKAKVLLERLGLSGQLRRLPNQMSGGQQQRVAIARALVHAPAIVVCDEPTASLDARSGQDVMDLLRTIALAPERAVLIVTHDARTYSYADRIVDLDDGRITSDRRNAAEEMA